MSTTAPFDTFGFQAPKHQDYRITLSDFGDKDFDLYVLAFVSQSDYRLIDAADSTSASQEVLIVSLDEDDVIRIEVEYHGQGGAAQAYELTIEAI